jgi:uncharacterized membrane protein|tara:strand:+ start:328 stop:723 length:396 start_codon:yes stop_codon:yes gene_type:complete
MEVTYIYAFLFVLFFIIIFKLVMKGSEESQEENNTITNESVPLQKSIPNQTEEKKEVQEHRVMVQIFYGLISIVLFLVGVAIKMAINLNENKGWRYKIFEKDTTINVMIVSIVVAIGLSIYIYRNQPPKKK